jgi:uroporphyrinogen-III synthase
MSDTSQPSPFTPRPRAVFTRPKLEARLWVEGLLAHGVDAIALPLIDIGSVDDPHDIHEAWQRLADYAAVMFVSANAVAKFFEQKPAVSSVDWSQLAIKTRAWATGPGTSRALQHAGLSPGQIDVPDDDAPQFDSEALWARVCTQVRPGQRVLIVRGSDAAGQGAGRDWLADQLAGAGVQVDRLIAYRRLAPVLSGNQQALARQAATDGSIWIFTSSEAIANLLALLPGQDWGRARAVAAHPRIATAARRAGFGVVCESRPALHAVVASIKSFE